MKVAAAFQNEISATLPSMKRKKKKNRATKQVSKDHSKESESVASATI